MEAEKHRLLQAMRREEHWRRWGPYLSERQWGTVREDYSSNGTAWEYFPFQHSHARTYRWGEDGIGGICDRHQMICFALALWNGKDPILKERLFGPVFEPLRESALFCQVSVDQFGAVCWPNGADLAPDALYERIRSPAAQSACGS